MDYLQYFAKYEEEENWGKSFKPCYKWITFNTSWSDSFKDSAFIVLNLVINGLPSILVDLKLRKILILVLNLVINGLPSIHN